MNILAINDYQESYMMGSGNLNQFEGRFMTNEPMSRHTSWRVGGMADRLYIPHDLEDLKLFLGELKEDEQLTWIGLGSNLLVRDGGIRGTVIATKNMEDSIILLKGGLLLAGAGMSCAQLAKTSVKYGLTGAEFLVGIPGTLGGALAMNAGAFGGETWGVVHSVTTINRRGVERIRSKEEFNIAYRNVELGKDEWFLSATLKLKSDIDQNGKAIIKDLLNRRSNSQPIGEASCGSVFKNPDTGEPAAKLIDKSGLKGIAIGGAVVSEKHANFILNKEDATAEDIEKLINKIQQVVKEKFNVLLIPEVRIIGTYMPEGTSSNG